MYRYDSEFDFESANARFKKEDLEEEFKQKLKVEDKRGDNGSAEGPLDAELEEFEQEGEEGGGDEFYDKSKSFFDSISCDAVKSQR